MNKKISFAFISFFLLLIITFVLGLALGSVNLGLKEIYQGLKDPFSTAYIIILQLRLPRVCAAALAGFALAVAGAVLQNVTNNHLCAPNIIGINAGAGFVVMVMLCFMSKLWIWLPIGAFAGALVTTFIVMSLAFYGGNRTQGTTIVLAGVAISSILNAGISFLSLRYPDVLTSYTAFSVGGFVDVSLVRLAFPAVIIAAAFIVLQCLAAKLNILCLGDEMAQSLGVNVKSIRIIALTASAALCAAAVSFAGLLGFVGLIVPHIARYFSQHDMRFQLGLSGIAGAILTILSDLGGRLLFAPSELPAGIIMALIGAPFFLYLLISRRHRYGRM